MPHIEEANDLFCRKFRTDTNPIDASKLVGIIKKISTARFVEI